jgi:hypothetical protein
MKKRKITYILISCIGILLLSACAALPEARPVSDSEMQTEIAMLLTSMVTETVAPIAATEEPTDTFEPTREPTRLPVVLVTATPEVVQGTPDTDIETLVPEGTLSAPTLDLITFTPDGTTTIDDNATGTPIKNTPTATATEPLTDIVDSLGDPFYTDALDNGDNWSLGKDTYVDLQAVNGNLVMQGLKTTSGWRLTNRSAKNFYLEITGKMEECTGEDQFGIMFRVPNRITATSGYLLGITCEGKYSLKRWDGETMLSLINWKQSDLIHSGSNQTNRIGIMADGNNMKVYINGVKVGEAADSWFPQGGYGLYVGARETTGLKALIDEVSIWILP